MNITLTSDNFKKTLSFETYQGVKYSNLKFQSLLDPETVTSFEDVAALHVQNLPYLPDPKPDAYTDYMYAKFTDAENAITYLGVPWVKESSIVETDTPNVTILLTAPTQEQLDSVKSMMVASGIENFKVKYT